MGSQLAQSIVVNKVGPKKVKGSLTGKDFVVFIDPENKKYFLGKGAFAEVYRGTIFNETSVQLAIKIVSRGIIQKFGGNFDKMRKYLENELNILKEINHKNIVQLKDFSQTINNFYLIFEFCDGGDL